MCINIYIYIHVYTYKKRAHNLLKKQEVDEKKRHERSSQTLLHRMIQLEQGMWCKSAATLRLQIHLVLLES